ncbi:MAG: thiamine pyrophosphate-binding protein [Lachnospiraceae bacterium]|nr:thiamine pyrophosphate-binding protein [Lachnospiraceae bacterium]
MRIKAAKYISRFMAEHGITDCFMVTGGGAMHLDDAIGHEKDIRCTFNHHEQACAIAAEGYTRMTGKLALVCVTSGPGGTNAITGVMGGWVDSIPMFVISGQVKRETTKASCPELNLRQLGDQEFDIINSVRNMTKYAVMLTDPKMTAYHLEKALYLALHGRGGPVWIDIPLDVQGAVIDTEDMPHFEPAREELWPLPSVKASAVERLINKIREAKAPLVLAGTGINLGDARGELLTFLDKYKLPVVTAWNANDTVAYDNPCYVGMPGTVGIRSGNFAVQNCDLLISLGCRMNIRMIGYTHDDFAKNAFKAVVDIDERELLKPTVHADLPIHADVKELLKALNDAGYEPLPAHEKWRSWCRELLQRFPAVRPDMHKGGGGLINPYVFTDRLFANLDENDRIICGNGSACVITFQAARIKQGQRMFTNSGCAAMGYGFPASIGVAVSDNSRRTVCIDGEGSFMMNLQELATVEYNKLEIKIFIINNNGYLSIRQTQRNLFEPPFIGIDKESGIGFPDFKKLAASFGIRYFRLEKETEADDTIREVLECEGPCICETVVDPDQSFEPKSSSRVMPDGSMVSPSLDDMSPFLEREIFDKIRYLHDGR